MNRPRYLTLLGVLLCFNVGAQQNTEVYLANLDVSSDTLKIDGLINISNNEGYDNQPSFYDNDKILFSSTRNGQTDIALYNIIDGTTTWISDTPQGGEYSPLRIPESNAISAVRLDITGLQRLYEYSVGDKSSKLILDTAKVGYHTWLTSDMLIATILVEDRMDLIVSHLADIGQFSIAQKNVGRALHKIPNTELVSFISKRDGLKSLNSMNPLSHEVKLISQLPKDTEDICWLPDGSFLIPKGNMIYRLRANGKNKEPEILSLSDFKEIHHISRMAVSPDGKHLALVSEIPPSIIVQKQVDSYNAGDLDAFVNCYDENVLVTNFPADTLYVGHEKMRNNYSGLAPDNKFYEVYVANRITIGNKVIDQESVKRNGEFQQMQVAVYEVDNGAISSMRFIFDKTDVPDPEIIVQQQLDAYNARDIEGFLATYLKDVKLYNFPYQLRTDGLEALRKGYTNFFESASDLHCEIKNRMVIGNIVIDEELVTANGNTFRAVAIYEVTDGRIAKVTFLR